MVLDHIGIAVPSLEHGLDQWELLFGYKRNSDIVLNTRQKVRVVFLSRPNSLPIKLIEPAGPESPVYPGARKGGGLHHLCFRCEQLETQILLLERRGARLLVPPQPGEAFCGHRIAFMLTGNINFELIDSCEKQGWVGEESAEPAHVVSK